MKLLKREPEERGSDRCCQLLEVLSCRRGVIRCTILGPQCRNSILSIQGNRSHFYSRIASMGYRSRRGALLVILMPQTNIAGSGTRWMMGRGTWFSTWVVQDLLKWFRARIVLCDGLPVCSRTLCQTSWCWPVFIPGCYWEIFCLKKITTV